MQVVIKYDRGKLTALLTNFTMLTQRNQLTEEPKM